MIHIRWANAATTDFFEICDFIARDRPRAAETVGAAILAAIAALPEHPRRGRPGRRAGTRELVLPSLPYLVVYTIEPGIGPEPETLYVTRILHGAQRWPPVEPDVG